MKTISGIGVSPGFGTGQLFFLTEQEIIIHSIIKSKTEESNLFTKILHDSEQQLTSLQTQALQKFGENEAAVFGSHLEILRDPALDEQVKALINGGKHNAAQAVQQVMTGYINIFKNNDDPYFQARAADINDVMRRLLINALNLEHQDLSTLNQPTIIVAKDLMPSQTVGIDPQYVQGIICEEGGATSHAAILTRNLKIPAVMAVSGALSVLKSKTSAYINGNVGTVNYDLNHDEIEQWKVQATIYKDEQIANEKFRNKPTITADGAKFLIEANIGWEKDIVMANEVGAEGVGLFRTEFLYMENNHFPTEEEQFVAYKAVATKHPHQITIRTLDIGGDKNLDYYKFESELNPFLGHRALRWCLTNDNIFRTQLRALLRASAFGKIAIMFPMVATLEELRAAKKILQEEKNKLINDNIQIGENIPVGIMIEIPAAAVMAEQFAQECDFFSIGTNDLIQYTLAADRINPRVGYLYQPLNPAIIRLVKMIADGAAKNNCQIAMCGEAAGDIRAIPIWIGLGVKGLSMSSSSILAARALINKINAEDAEAIVKKALQMKTAAEVANLIKNQWFNNKNI